MRYSEMIIPTLRDIPNEAEVVSHCLMLRGGYIRRLAAGVYNFLPLGWRVIRNIDQIIREEMEKAGAQEVFLPVLCPSELWQESGRWDAYGKELMRITDRHNRQFCLGPTHEEIITDLVRKEVHSYRQLPLNLYQIQTKFRDEIRPRFGLMRGREFMMKDGYSFDKDEQGAQISYALMFKAYNKIFARCGLKFRAVEADTGLIGGSFSHEFMVLADSGEDSIVSCTDCDFASNLEKAECPEPFRTDALGIKSMKEPMEVYTPGKKSVEDVCNFLDMKPQQLIKTIIFVQKGEPVVVLVRGDHEVNEVKLRNLLGGNEVIMAEEALINTLTGGPSGFSGPVGLDNIKILADFSVMGMENATIGGNKADTHIINVNLNRDFKVSRFADLRFITPDDSCVKCGGTLVFNKGIEVGHVFKLGTKYSKAMRCTFLAQDGKEQFMVMGCYGIGVSRIAAAAIEQNHDADGIIWPLPIAPFQVQVLPLNMDNEDVSRIGEEIYNELREKGLEVLLDDRDESPGIKFKDADLLGIPLRVTVGIKSLKEGKLEIKWRDSKEVIKQKRPEIPSRIVKMIEERMISIDSKMRDSC